MQMWCATVLCGTISCIGKGGKNISWLCLHNTVYIIFWHKLQKVKKSSVFLAKNGFLAYYL